MKVDEYTFSDLALIGLDLCFKFRVIRKAYLWNAGYNAKTPGQNQHDTAPLVRIVQTKGMNNGKVPVQTDGHQNERRQIQSQNAEKHEDPAGRVARLPGHRDVPDDLQGEHDEGDHQVSDGQVEDELIHAWLDVTVPEQRDEHGQVPARRHDEHARVGDDSDHVLVREH